MTSDDTLIVQLLSVWVVFLKQRGLHKWSKFLLKTGLMWLDGIHPTLDGTDLLSRNMAKFVSHPNY